MNNAGIERSTIEMTMRTLRMVQSILTFLRFWGLKSMENRLLPYIITFNEGISRKTAYAEENP